LPYNFKNEESRELGASGEAARLQDDGQQDYGDSGFNIPQASFQAELFSDRTRQCIFDFGVTRHGRNSAVCRIRVKVVIGTVPL
jgi:hypothetical protein